MFLGINMFLALLRAHFNPRYARAKMILSRAKNIFMPANVNSIVIIMKHNNIKTTPHHLHEQFTQMARASQQQKSITVDGLLPLGLVLSPNPQKF